MVFEPEVIELAMQYPSLVRDLEHTFGAMVVDSARTKMILPAVNREKRTVQHAVARSFGLESQVSSKYLSYVRPRENNYYMVSTFNC